MKKVRYSTFTWRLLLWTWRWLLSRLRWICYDKDVDYRLMKKLADDFPFTWRLLLRTWRWLFGYLSMGRLLDVILVLSSRWLMVDVDLILKRRWLLGNNGDFPFTWCRFNTEFKLTYGWRGLDIKMTLTIGYLPLRFRSVVFCFGHDVNFSVTCRWAVYLTSF